MFSKDKSVKFTHLIVRVCYFMLAAAVISLPVIFNYLHVRSEVKPLWIIVPFYCVVPMGYAALISLDKMLCNIKKNIVFDIRNAESLKNLAICCFCAALAGLVSFIIIAAVHKYFIIIYLILSAGELFMALISQILKNVFDAAIDIKQENELTI